MTTNTNAAPDNCTVLPDGSAFATASYPLPKNHWLYAPREYEPGAEEPKELPHPILTHAHRAEVVAAVRYAIRGATMCGKEKDFDPDALVQNAVYALCGPYGKAALSTAAQPQEELREDASYESMNLAVMVLSDCGHSSNYTPLLERVAGRIDRHVERLLTAQRADLTRRAQAEPVQPPAGIWVPTELADRVQETMVNDVKQYPPLPAPDTHCFDEDTGKDVWSYSADQMRAYVDADRAMRAAQAAPAAWRHSRTYSVYEAAEQVPIADGDEWAEPLYLHPPEAQAAPAAWMDDGTLRSGSTETSHRVVTAETKAGMPSSTAAAFTVPLYTKPAAPASQDAEDALVAALERAYFWMDSQADAQSKGGHATFDLMMLREERDAAKAAIDAARSKQEAK